MQMRSKALLVLPTLVALVVLITSGVSADELCPDAVTECSTVYMGRGWCVEICPDYPNRFVYDPSAAISLPVSYYVDGGGITFPDGPFNVTLHIVDSFEDPEPTRCICANESGDEATIGSGGWAFFNFRGGGCNGSYTLEFHVQDTTKNHTYVVYRSGYNPLFFREGPSSDAVDDAGREAWKAGWDPGELCVVGLSDATYHTPAIIDNLESLCSNLDGINKTDIVDAVNLTPSIQFGSACPRLGR